MLPGKKFYYGKGCDHCNGSGYKGRTAIFEIIDVNNALKELILSKASANKIRLEAQRNGMVTLREAGVAKVFAGVSTIEEVVRETIDVFE